MPGTDKEIASVFGFNTNTVRRRKVQRFSDVTGQAKAKGRGCQAVRTCFALPVRVTSRSRFPGLIWDVGQ